MTDALYAVAGFAIGNWLPILVVALPATAIVLLASSWGRQHKLAVAAIAILGTAAVFVFNMVSLGPEPYLQRLVGRLAPTQRVVATCDMARSDFGYGSSLYATYACAVTGVCALPVELEVSHAWTGRFSLPEGIRLDRVFAPGCIGGRPGLDAPQPAVSG